MTLAASGLPAQETRGETLVTVRGDRDAWNGATVVLLSRPFPLDARVGVEDRVEVILDERARARARLLRGRHYSVWAHRSHADGTRTVTEVLEAVCAGMPVVLEPEPRARPPVELRVRGAEPWRESGPLRCRITSSIGNAEQFDVELPEDGVVRIPAQPGDRLWIDVLRNDGMLLTANDALVTSWSLTRPVPLLIHPPRLYAVRIVDAVTGAGIGDATIRRNPSALELPLARTLADGTTSITLPLPRHARRGFALQGDLLLALASGRAPALVEADRDGVLVATLSAARRIEGQVLDRNGGAAGSVSIVWIDRIERLHHSFDPIRIRHVARTDPDGRFALDTLPSAERPTLCLVLPPDLTPDGCDPLVIDALDDLEHDDREPWTIDLRALARVDLDVRDTDRTPARFAKIRRGIGVAMGRRPLVVESRTDARGHASFLVRDRLTPMFVSSATGSALIDASGAIVDGSGHARAALDLRPRLKIAGEAIWASGLGRPHESYQFMRLLPRPESIRPADFPVTRGPLEIRDRMRVAFAMRELDLRRYLDFATDPAGAFTAEFDDFGARIGIWAQGQMMPDGTGALLEVDPAVDDTTKLLVVDDLKRHP